MHMGDDNRPVFLNLFQIQFPITAIVSIGHRISGMIMLLSLPLWLWLMQMVLSGEAHFQQLQTCLNMPHYKCLLWAMIMAVVYHALAGLRHLVMDFGWWESWSEAKASAWGVLFFFAVMAIWVGVKLW